ncbi:MAG: DUF4252 domain-containing protein [Flavobacteriales bacterium]|nr:DUF4252 domain-containing protein [Flavobacteriales bacterium]MDG1779725.1 DUF4252 domain-containing protein [Flavobacteriales bacterium]MDG2247216.1 DUF4252 domain-containing protein [Flavobacteriales bacterium]
MKYIITLTIALFSVTTFAQDAVEKYFSAYANDDSFTSISISGKMFQLLTHIEGQTDEEKEILETVSKLEGMRMLVKSEAEDVQSMYRSSIKMLGNEFEELMRVEDNEEDLIFFIREQKGLVRELVLIGSGGGELFIMSILGDIDLNQIAKIGRAVQVDGFEHLEKIGEE